MKAICVTSVVRDPTMAEWSAADPNVCEFRAGCLQHFAAVFTGIVEKTRSWDTNKVVEAVIDVVTPRLPFQITKSSRGWPLTCQSTHVSSSCGAFTLRRGIKRRLKGIPCRPTLTHSSSIARSETTSRTLAGTVLSSLSVPALPKP